jgi:membrane protein DedA with SNARE-associated domain
MSPSKKSRPARRRKPKAAAPPAPPRTDLRTILLRLAGLVLVIGITAYVYTIRTHVKEFAAFGYPGIFLVMLLANATVIIPAPGLAVVFAMGGIFNPLGVAVAGGTGGALGELTGYLAGLSGQAVIEKADIYNRVHPWVEKYGGWAVLVLAAIPNPFFDLAGIAAGAIKMTFSRFLLFCWIGQLIKMSVFAFAGAYSLDWILNLTAR